MLLCEDQQHAAFVRRFLAASGLEVRTVRERICPAGAGDAWVTAEFPGELRWYRRSGASTILIVMLDADVRSVDDRHRQLEQACRDAGVEPRRPDERVAIIVPKRNVETWLAWLTGTAVDEDATYAKLRHERDCDPQAKALARMCRSSGLRDGAPASLERACEEWRNHGRERGS